MQKTSSLMVRLDEQSKSLLVSAAELPYQLLAAMAKGPPAGGDEA